MTTQPWSFMQFMTPFTGYPYVGERVKCPNCGGDSVTIARLDRKWKRLSTDVCKSCGLFFTNPMPRDDELEAYYASMYRSTYLYAFDSVPEEHVHKKRADAENRAGIVAGLFEPGRAGLRSIDLGCGLGELVASLERRGFDAFGFEPGELWSKHLNSGRITRGSWQNLDYPEHSFDFASIIHVLEHLRSPLACLRKVHTLLKDDGLLWIEVPDMQAYGIKNWKRFHFAHVLGFSRANLVDAAFRCGFVPIKDISKEQIRKRRNQVSVVFRKAQPGDTIDVDLEETAERNRREYSRFAILNRVIGGGRKPARMRRVASGPK